MRCRELKGGWSINVFPSGRKTWFCDKFYGPPELVAFFGVELTARAINGSAHWIRITAGGCELDCYSLF
jgi:hypothetical protein